MEGVIQIKRNRDQPCRFCRLAEPRNRWLGACDGERRGRIDGGNLKAGAAFFEHWRDGFRRCANRRHAAGAAGGVLMPAARHNKRRRLIES